MYDFSHNNMNRIIESVMPSILPPEKIIVPEWAEKNRILTKPSKFLGKWKNRFTPWLVEPMECMSPTNPTRHIVLMFGSQLGKTESIFNTLMTFIDTDPCAMLFYLPTETMAEKFSKDRLLPVLQACDKLKKHFPDKSRDGKNTIMSKSFPGGTLYLFGANSPANAAGFPARVLFRDEIDRYGIDVGGEGDFLSLTEQRTDTFTDDKKIIDTSTPSEKGKSPVEQMFEKSDQRHWYVPCPHCGEYHELLFRRRLHEDDEKETRMMHFERNEAGAVTYAYMICPHCGSIIEEHHKPEMQKNGKYIAHKPGAKRAGFFANGLNSLFRDWVETGERWFDAQGDYMKLKTFVNVILGQTWEDSTEYVRSDTIKKRARGYDTVPNDVLILLCSVDVQPDRLEGEICGYGIGDERWGVKYFTVHGSYKEQSTWDELRKILVEPLTREDGRKQKIMSTFIDSSDGNSMRAVYKFCRANKSIKCFAIKGNGGDKLDYLVKRSFQKEYNVTLLVLNTNALKNISQFALQVKEVGAGYCHFPKNNGYDSEYYEQLTSEHIVKEFDKRTNKEKKHWKKKTTSARNESWDVFCYNRANLEFWNINWEKWAGNPRGIVSDVIDNRSRTKSSSSQGIEV